MFIRSSVRAHRIFIVNSESMLHPRNLVIYQYLFTFWTSWPSSLYVRKICPEQAFKKPKKPKKPEVKNIFLWNSNFLVISKLRNSPETSEEGGGSATMQNTMIHACTVSNRHQYNRNYSNSTYIPITVNVNFIRFINSFKSRLQEEIKTVEARDVDGSEILLSSFNGQHFLSWNRKFP